MAWAQDPERGEFEATLGSVPSYSPTIMEGTYPLLLRMCDVMAVGAMSTSDFCVRVRCWHKDKGCDWVGEVNELKSEE